MSILLIVRGLIGIGFGVAAGLSPTATWQHFFDLLSSFLIVDGAVAGGIGAALLRQGTRRNLARETGLGSVLAGDALCRIAAGAALHFLPGISGFPVSSVVFVATMAICTAAVGGAEAWLTAREEIARHGAGAARGQLMAGPVGIASLVSIGFGMASLFYIDSPAAERLSISAFIIVAGVVSLAMAWSHQRMERQRAAAVAAATT